METRPALERALRLHQAGDLAAAEQLYRSLLTQNPRDFASLHLLGVLRAQQGHPEEAAELTGRALRVDPSVAMVWCNQANILADLGRREEALASYDKAVSLSGDVGIQHQRARMLLEMERPAQALAALVEVLAVQPANFEAAKDHAAALCALGRNHEARKCYEALLAEQPDDLELLNNFANLLRAGREFEIALELYDRALGIRADLAEVWSNRAADLSELGRHADALDSADHALALKPDMAEAWNNRGDALRELGRLDEALDSLERALARMPDYPAALNNRAKLLCEMHRISEGFASFRQAAHLVYGGRASGVVGSAFQDAQARYCAQEGLGQGGRLETPALQSKVWAATAEAAWQTGDPRVVVIDDFLTADALMALRRFCWSAPVWHRTYNAGYVGAFPESGFASPLLAQIAEELASGLPSIIGDHALRYFWAFSYDGGGAGTDAHADEAMINVNFWITPDEANRGRNGGLIVWDKAAPQDWNFDQFNNDSALAKEYLALTGARQFRIPYRANRAVVFDSGLFHQTDEFSFGSGYCERRLNITFLYGRRALRRTSN